MRLPKRSDSIYQEIENFEDYEYTNCIAYEMMIRCPEVLKDREWLVNELIPLYHDDKITKDELYEIFYLKDYGLDFFNLAHIDNLNRGFFDGKKISIEILKNNNYFQRKSFSSNDFTFKDNIEIKINVHLSRPKLRFPKNPRSICKLNFNLPKDELIAYISKIKDEYDKENSIIKSPLEMIGIESEKANDQVPGKRTIADKFFIYDYYKAVKHKSLADIDIWRDIDLELIMYYDHDVLKGDYYSEKTYKNYKKEMIDFIDNLGYKKLITGTTNKG
ncbi:hypothetical protein [Aliarcobacter cryaerophilus]|uniref:hypothetical protein n=1 Tax=Aliarcobacter cryaerophilus TaxID=28198 RepID=UPI003DA346AB